MAYLALKVPLALLAFFTAFSLWFDAFRCLTYPLWSISHHDALVEWGVVRVVFQPGYLSPGSSGPFVALATVITGAIFFFVAPGRCGSSTTWTAYSCARSSLLMP